MDILSKRVVMENETNKKRHCFDIIFEWEDIIAKALNCNIFFRSNFEFEYDNFSRKIYRKIHIPLYRLFDLFDKKRGNILLMFDGSTKQQDGIYNNPRYIPCLIDYFLDENMYSNFLRAYKNNKLVLVSSREVYEYLVRKNCPIKVEYFPLSLPDYYKTNEIYNKKYDLIIAGRVNPLLSDYVNRYEGEYPNLRILRRKYEDGHFKYYLSANGEEVSVGDTREQYINLLRQSKIALYTTPGMDGTRPDANGWNQVTPRFLEEVAAQCHIIARFPKNPDTDWYCMDKICHNIESYDDFKNTMEEYLKKDIDIDLYNGYLEKHYTSKRVEMLKDIIKRNDCIFHSNGTLSLRKGEV